MSGIVGSRLNNRGSGLIGSLGTDGQVLTSSGAGVGAVYEAGAIDDNAVTLAKMAGLARGKLIYGDASGDPAALAAGSADEVLTHDGTDFDWAAAGGGGKVLQCLFQSYATYKSQTSATYAGTGLTLSITPADTANKILIQASMKLFVSSQTSMGFRLKRNIGGAGETLIHLFDDNWGMTSGQVSSTAAYSDQRFDGQGNILYLDAPSTTSATVYSIDYANMLANSEVNINGAYSGGTGTAHPLSTLVLTEMDFS